MKTKKCKEQFIITNFDEFKGDDKHERKRHSNLLPDHCRGIICGPSGCGKTNVMINLIINENGLKFKHIYIYCNSLFQSKYKLLQLILHPLKHIKYNFFDVSNAIISPLQAKKNSIFIFDDVICDKQDIMKSYFTMGRHRDIDTFYLGQTYSKIPKQLIRDNVNLLIVFKQDDTNIKHIYDDHVNTDMTLIEFKNICQLCWVKKHDFLLICKDFELTKGRYRKGFDIFITSFK